MKKLSLMAIFEDLTNKQVKDLNQTNQYEVTPHPLGQPTPADINQQYEEEGYFNEPMEGPNQNSQVYPNSGGDLPWQTPNANGWQTSQIPQSPQAPQEIEDFSQQMEQDSPAPQRPGLRPPAQLQPNQSEEFKNAHPWGPNNGGVGAQKFQHAPPKVQQKVPNKRKSMKIPVR